MQATLHSCLTTLPRKCLNSHRVGCSQLGILVPLKPTICLE